MRCVRCERLVLCATYLHLLSRLMRTRTSWKSVFNEPPPIDATATATATPPERIARASRQLLCSTVAAGRQHSKSLHHHERICDAWTASPLDAGSHINCFVCALLNPRFKPLICSSIQSTLHLWDEARLRDARLLEECKGKRYGLWESSPEFWYDEM